jgi:hypothetical protein
MHQWSAHYFILSIMESIALLGVLLRRRKWIALSVMLVLISLSSGASRVQTFAFDLPNTWASVSSVNSYRISFAQVLTGQLINRLLTNIPAPRDSATFAFSLVPEGIGLQAGGGPFVRWVYQNPTLDAHYGPWFGTHPKPDYTITYSSPGTPLHEKLKAVQNRIEGR